MLRVQRSQIMIPPGSRNSICGGSYYVLFISSQQPENSNLHFVASNKGPCMVLMFWVAWVRVSRLPILVGFPFAPWDMLRIIVRRAEPLHLWGQTQLLTRLNRDPDHSTWVVRSFGQQHEHVALKHFVLGGTDTTVRMGIRMGIRMDHHVPACPHNPCPAKPSQSHGLWPGVVNNSFCSPRPGVASGRSCPLGQPLHPPLCHRHRCTRSARSNETDAQRAHRTVEGTSPGIGDHRSGGVEKENEGWTGQKASYNRFVCFFGRTWYAFIELRIFKIDLFYYDHIA